MRKEICQKIDVLYREHGSWRAVGEALAMPYMVCYDYVNRPNHVSHEQFMALAEALDVHPPKRKNVRYYRPCLSVEIKERLERLGLGPEVVMELGLDEAEGLGLES